MSKAMLVLTFSVAIALASAACGPGDEFDKLSGKACPKQRQASISTDNRGNININTAVNGNVVVVRREEAAISIKDMIDDIAGNKKSIAEMQKNAALYTSAQDFMTSLTDKTITKTTEIQVEQANQRKDLKRVLDDLAGIEKKIDNTVDALKKDVAKSLQEGDAKIAESVKNAAAAATQAKKDADAAMTKSTDALKKQVEDATKPVKALSDSYGKDSLFMPRRTFQLVDWKASASGARGAGRVFYKTIYNVGAAGHFQCDRRELRTACSDLSAYLKSRDGVDRALKPACDNPSHCGSQGVSLPNSYLSHYGCNGSYRESDRGYGLPLTFMSGVVMYNREHSWHGCHMLINRGNKCDHGWTNSHDHSTNKGRSTLCTSSNGNFKRTP